MEGVSRLRGTDVDLALYARVIWRFRLIVALGLLLAVALALFSLVKVNIKNGSPTLSYRAAETWQSQETLLITQRGFPWGRTVSGGLGAAPAPTGTTPSSEPGFANPSRFGELALFYYQIANSDAVRIIAARRGLPEGSFTALPGVNSNSVGGGPAPFLKIIGFARTPEAAITLARRGSDAFRTYLSRRQSAASIPVSERVQIQAVNYARTAQLLAGRSKTIPIVVFFAVMMAALGLAFILENVRPRVRLVAAPDEETPQVKARRGA